MKKSLGFLLFVGLALGTSCGRPTVFSSDQRPDPQKLPFDRQPQAGIVPSRTFVPSPTQIPAGTAITVSLEHSLSSASARSNETFTALLDEPVVIDGQTIIAPGAPITGRILDVRPATSPRAPGYLRIALVEVNTSGKQVPIATSSLFAKGGAREGRDVTSDSSASTASTSREMVFAPGRRLSFRLTENVDLP